MSPPDRVRVAIALWTRDAGRGSLILLVRHVVSLSNGTAQQERSNESFCGLAELAKSCLLRPHLRRLAELRLPMKQ